MTSTTQPPTFIDWFGFHLAINLCGQSRVSNALSSEEGGHEGPRKRSLYWRSSFLPLYRCDERDGSGSGNGNERAVSSKKIVTKQDRHVFFIDVTVDFIRPACAQQFQPPRVEARFGAMIESPAELDSPHAHNHEHESTHQRDRGEVEGGAIYIQSNSWKIQDVECYSPDSMCVESTGASGCAEAISNAILHGEPNMVKAKDYRPSHEGGRLSARIATFDNELMEEVTILRACNIITRDGYVGPKALEMFQHNANTYSRTSDESRHNGTVAQPLDAMNQNESLDESFKEWFKPKQEFSPTNSFNNEQNQDDTNLSDNDDERNNISTQSQLAWENDFFCDVDNSQMHSQSQTQSQTQNSQEVSFNEMNNLQATSNHIQENARESELEVNTQSDNPPKTPKKRLRVVHGAARSRKRKKKGKMTFGKL